MIPLHAQCLPVSTAVGAFAKNPHHNNGPRAYYFLHILASWMDVGVSGSYPESAHVVALPRASREHGSGGRYFYSAFPQLIQYLPVQSFTLYCFSCALFISGSAFPREVGFTALFPCLCFFLVSLWHRGAFPFNRRNISLHY